MRGGRMREHLEARVAWLEALVPGMPPADEKLEIFDAFAEGEPA
jgi:hypothetical protein